MSHFPQQPRPISIVVIVIAILFAISSARVHAQVSPSTPAQPPPGTLTPTNPSSGNDVAAQGDDTGAFVLKQDVEEVILHATVVDEQHHLVPDLDQGAFTVFEDQTPQNITSFHREDVPVAMGILIDNSGSMREKRQKVNEAVLNLLLHNNPDDEIFVVNFNQDAYLDQDFTSDVGLLRQALLKVSMRGSTALYDALVASSVHLSNRPRPENRVMLVITDGWDDASRETLQQARGQLQRANGPVLYAIGLLDPAPADHGGRAVLDALAESTGGAAFFPSSLDELNDISRTIGRDIRSRYTIGYKSTNSGDGYRTIRVEARAPGYTSLTVRTRQGYYPGEATH